MSGNRNQRPCTCCHVRWETMQTSNSPHLLKRTENCRLCRETSIISFFCQWENIDSWKNIFDFLPGFRFYFSFTFRFIFRFIFSVNGKISIHGRTFLIFFPDSGFISASSSVSSSVSCIRAAFSLPGPVVFLRSQVEKKEKDGGRTGGEERNREQNDPPNVFIQRISCGTFFRTGF